MQKLVLGAFLVGASFFTVSCNSGENSPSSSQTAEAMVTDISVDEFMKIKDERPGVIVDVRTPAETSTGIVEGAVLIDITQPNFMDEAMKLPKDKPLYIYCKAGGRSANASQKMLDAGYTQVYNVEGGMTSWLSKGYPVVK
jgi:rhodanese-related sulfurtransferase